jgi:hypothetical protein
MAATLTYTDAYLSRSITESIETRAFADVDELGTFQSDWRNRMTVVRAYILTCLEKGAQAGDTYEMKLGQYRKEFDFVLSQAKRAQAAADSTINVPIFTIPIERA